MTDFHDSEDFQSLARTMGAAIPYLEQFFRQLKTIIQTQERDTFQGQTEGLTSFGPLRLPEFSETAEPAPELLPDLPAGIAAAFAQPELNETPIVAAPPSSPLPPFQASASASASASLPDLDFVETPSVPPGDDSSFTFRADRTPELPGFDSPPPPPGEETSSSFVSHFPEPLPEPAWATSIGRDEVPLPSAPVLVFPSSRLPELPPSPPPRPEVSPQESFAHPQPLPDFPSISRTLPPVSVRDSTVNNTVAETNENMEEALINTAKMAESMASIGELIVDFQRVSLEVMERFRAQLYQNHAASHSLSRSPGE